MSARCNGSHQEQAGMSRDHHVTNVLCIICCLFGLVHMYNILQDFVIYEANLDPHGLQYSIGTDSGNVIE